MIERRRDVGSDREVGGSDREEKRCCPVNRECSRKKTQIEKKGYLTITIPLTECCVKPEKAMPGSVDQESTWNQSEINRNLQSRLNKVRKGAKSFEVFMRTKKHVLNK